jgi:ABC-type branched-subunit amino acid transport system ATPase component
MKPLLIAEGLASKRGGRQLFSNVNIRVQPGERILLRGPNGSGKSTFLRALAGVEAPDSGSVILWDRPVSTWASWKREQLSPLVDQHPIVELEVVAWYNLVDSLVVPTYFQWWVGSRRRIYEAVQRQTRGLVEAFDLGDSLDQKTSELSYGQRRLLTLIRALRPLSDNRPRLLLLDEPLAGLSAAHAGVAIELLNLRIRDGWAVLIAEHLPIAEELRGGRELHFPVSGN